MDLDRGLEVGIVAVVGIESELVVVVVVVVGTEVEVGMEGCLDPVRAVQR